MNLKQELINKVLLEASDKLRTIDANAGLIAEAEALGERLRAHLPTECCTSTPVVTVLQDGGVTARIQINGRPRHEITAAIAAAGISIASESDVPWGSAGTLIYLAGFDVPIHDTTPRTQLAEAA